MRGDDRDNTSNLNKAHDALVGCGRCAAAGVGVRASFFCKYFSRCSLLARLACSSVCPFSTLLLQFSSCLGVLSFSIEFLFSLVTSSSVTWLSSATSDWLLGDTPAAPSDS